LPQTNGRRPPGFAAISFTGATSQYRQAKGRSDAQVGSTTLRAAEWPESRIASGDLSEEINGFKREPGNDLIAYGGARFAQALSRSGLIDECRLVIHPMVLGAGKPLFSELPAPLHLELAEAHEYETGTAIHVYRPRASRGEGEE
jgi:dihydrofolate reductase